MRSTVRFLTVWSGSASRIATLIVFVALSVMSVTCSSGGRSFDVGRFASGLFSLSIEDEKELGSEFLQEIRKTVRLVTKTR